MKRSASPSAVALTEPSAEGRNATASRRLPSRVSRKQTHTQTRSSVSDNDRPNCQRAKKTTQPTGLRVFPRGKHPRRPPTSLRRCNPRPVIAHCLRRQHVLFTPPLAERLGTPHFSTRGQRDKSAVLTHGRGNSTTAGPGVNSLPRNFVEPSVAGPRIQQTLQLPCLVNVLQILGVELTFADSR